MVYQQRHLLLLATAGAGADGCASRCPWISAFRPESNIQSAIAAERTTTAPAVDGGKEAVVGAGIDQALGAYLVPEAHDRKYDAAICKPLADSCMTLYCCGHAGTAIISTSSCTRQTLCHATFAPQAAGLPLHN